MHAVFILSRLRYRHVIELIGRYAELGLGFVDASIVTAAERLGVTTIATLNRRDWERMGHDGDMSEMRVGAHVHGVDGDLGRVEALVIDPVALAVTHLVVGHGVTNRVLVPVAAITEASPEVVTVDLSEADYDRLEPFDVQAEDPVTGGSEDPPLGLDVGSYFLSPFSSPLDGMAEADREAIPDGEVTIRRGDEVWSNDRTKVGHIDEFLVHPHDGLLTHLVLREGHVLHHQDVVVPIHGSQFAEGEVTLGLSFAELEALEHIPVRRHGHVHGEDVTR